MWLNNTKSGSNNWWTQKYHLYCYIVRSGWKSVHDTNLLKKSLNNRISPIFLYKCRTPTRHKIIKFRICYKNHKIWTFSYKYPFFSCQRQLLHSGFLCRPSKVQLGSRISESTKGRSLKFGIRVTNGMGQVPL